MAARNRSAETKKVSQTKAATTKSDDNGTLLCIGSCQHVVFEVNALGGDGRMRGERDAEGDYINGLVCEMPSTADILVFIRPSGVLSDKKLLSKVLARLVTGTD